VALGKLADSRRKLLYGLRRLTAGYSCVVLLMRRVEKRVYDSHRLRDHLLSLRLILRIGKFRAIEKRSRFYNARFQTGLVGFDMKLVTSILNDFAGYNALSPDKSGQDRNRIGA